MKLILLCFCLFILSVQGLNSKDDAVKSVQECLKENGIKEEDIEKLKENGDPKLECIMACVFEKGGLIKDGKIDEQLLKKGTLEDFPELGEQKVSKMVDTCMNLAKDLVETCKKANLIGMCIKEELEKLDIKLNK